MPHGFRDGILVPRPRMEPMPPAVEAWSPNHWTAREFPSLCEQNQYAFWFAFLCWLVMLSTFLCTCWPFTCLLWKNVYSVSVLHTAHIQLHTQLHITVPSERNPETSWVAPTLQVTEKISTLKWVGEAETHTHHKPHPWHIAIPLWGNSNSQLLPGIYVFFIGIHKW